MVNPSSIKEHMEVVGSDGAHVGTVDHFDGATKIKLTKSDAASGGEHHWITLDSIASVDTAIHLNMPAEQARQQWQSAE